MVDLCDFFELKPFKIYKVIVEEKALGHAKNMLCQWELCKERMKNET